MASTWHPVIAGGIVDGKREGYGALAAVPRIWIVTQKTRGISIKWRLLVATWKGKMNKNGENPTTWLLGSLFSEKPMLASCIQLNSFRIISE